METGKFRKIGHEVRKNKDKFVEIEIFQIGTKKIEIQKEDGDQILCLTVSPKDWLNTNLVLPTGHRDESGRPVYQIFEKQKGIPKPKPLK